MSTGPNNHKPGGPAREGGILSRIPATLRKRQVQGQAMRLIFGGISFQIVGACLGWTNGTGGFASHPVKST